MEEEEEEEEEEGHYSNLLGEEEEEEDEARKEHIRWVVRDAKRKKKYVANLAITLSPCVSEKKISTTATHLA